MIQDWPETLPKTTAFHAFLPKRLGFTFIRVDLLRDHVHQVLGHDRCPLPVARTGDVRIKGYSKHENEGDEPEAYPKLGICSW